MGLDVVGVVIVPNPMFGVRCFFWSSTFSNDSTQSTQIREHPMVSRGFRTGLVRRSEAMGATEATVDEASLAQDVASVLGRRVSIH